MRIPSGLSAAKPVASRIDDMPSASNLRHRVVAARKAQPPAPHIPRKADWARPAEYDAEPTPLRGKGAVQHDTGAEARGRRSTRFPDLHISATAAKLGIAKSHLGKVLAGTSRPSAELTLRLAEVLGKDADYVLSLYKDRQARKSKPKR